MTLEAMQYRGVVERERYYIGEMVEYCIAAGCLNTRGDGAHIGMVPQALPRPSSASSTSVAQSLQLLHQTTTKSTPSSES